MQKDKMRTLIDSEVLQEVSDEEFFKEKGLKFEK